MKDCITLKGMEFYGYHGCYEEEKKVGQVFLVDAVLEKDLSRPGETDCLEDTINYAAVFDTIRDIVECNTFNLIERLAFHIAETVLQEYDVNAVEITVHKPKAPIDGRFSDAAVTIRRERNVSLLFEYRL